MNNPSHDTGVSLETYRRVSELVRQGDVRQARELALAIPVEHLRCRALLLANDSREVRRPDALRR